jgi:hypothetical protein
LQIGSNDEPKADEFMADALAALGLYCEDDQVIDEDEFWLWPENEEAWWLWCTVQTQWVIGMAGPVGLNYPGVESCMRMRGIPKKRIAGLFGLIQAMESAALEEWAAKG